MANSKKLDVVSIVIIAVMVVGFILTIVGICTSWISQTASYMGSSNTELVKLSEYFENEATDMDGFGAMYAFSIITIIVTALAAVAYAVSKFVDIKVLKYVVIGVSALAIICAILALILTFTHINAAYSDMIDYAEAMGGKYTVVPTVGCWVLALSGIVGGAAGVYGGLKK